MKNENLDPSDLPDNTIQLDLNHYGLESLTDNFFARVKYLEKVDLSNNRIVYIEEVIILTYINDNNKTFICRKPSEIWGF